MRENDWCLTLFANLLMLGALLKRNVKHDWCSASRLVIYLVLIGGILNNVAYAHSGDDPNRELEKLNNQVKSHNAEFKSLSDTKEKKKNISQQIRGVRSTILLLRNELSGTRANRCIKNEDEIDYFKELDKALKASEKALVQLKQVIQ